MSNKSKDKSLEDLIVDLYLNVKIRKQEEIENYDQESFDIERENLKKKNPKTLIEYITSSIEILINLKVEEKLNSIKESKEKISLSPSNNQYNSDEDDVNEYEKLLRQLEGEIRNHIRIEHQLKLHSDNLQSRVEELEKAKDDLKLKCKKLSEQLKKVDNNSEESIQSNQHDKKKNSEIQSLKNEIESLRTVVKSYEERNINISDLEKKIRLKQANFDKEIEHYKEKIKALNKKIFSFEEYIKKSSSNIVGKDVAKPKNIIIGEIILDKQKISQAQSNLSRSTDKTDKKKEEIVVKNNPPSSQLTARRILEKKTSMENLSHVQLNTKSKSMIRVDEFDEKSNKSNFKKNISMNSNTIKDSSSLYLKIADNAGGSKTYRKPTKELVRDPSKTNLAVKLTKHNRNNSYDISKNEKEKKTIYSQKDTNNNNYGNTNNIPYFNNINIFAANMNNFKTSELNLKQFVINKVNNKQKSVLTKHNPRSSSTVKN